jgi:hypothetical protein
MREAAANSVAFTAAGLMTLGRVFHLLKCKYGQRFDLFKVDKALKGVDWNKSAEMWRGNLTDENGNMKSGTAGQVAAAELIVEVVSSYLEFM